MSVFSLLKESHKSITPKEFDDIVFRFLEHKDNPYELVSATVRASRLCLSYSWYSNTIKVVQDLSLEFLAHLHRGGLLTTPYKRLARIAKDILKKHDRLVRFEGTVLEPSHQKDPDYPLIVEDIIKTILRGVPNGVKSAIMYVLSFPERLKGVLSLYSPPEKYLIIRGLFKLKNKLNISSKQDGSLDLNLPTTQITRLLLLSVLYKVSPLALVVLMESKSLDSLYKLCMLFEGQELRVPTVAELTDVLNSASKLTRDFEESESVETKESLAYLATDIENIEELTVDTELNPLLSNYFEKALDISFTNYKKFQDGLIRNVDWTNIEDVRLVHEIFNKEINLQINMMSKIMQAVTSTTEMKEFLEVVEKIDKRETINTEKGE